MGFLYENVTLVYFLLLVELSSILSSTVSHFRTFGFLSLSAGCFSEPRRTYLTTLHCFSWLLKTKHRKGMVFGSLYRIRQTYIKTVILTIVIPFSISFSKRGITLRTSFGCQICPKMESFWNSTVAAFVQKAGLIWQRSGVLPCFLLRLFLTQMYVVDNHWGKHNNGTMLPGKKSNLFWNYFE